MKDKEVRNQVNLIKALSEAGITGQIYTKKIEGLYVVDANDKCLGVFDINRKEFIEKVRVSKSENVQEDQEKKANGRICEIHYGRNW